MILKNLRRRRGLLSTLFLFLFTANSCKKEKFSDAALPAQASVAEGKTVDNKNATSVLVKPDEIQTWLKTNVTELNQHSLQFNKAGQKTINGHHVVKIPITSSSALFFTKDNGGLKVYAYKWETEVADSARYTGKLLSFSFQDYAVTALKYTDGKIAKSAQVFADKSFFIKSFNTTKQIQQTNVIADLWCLLTGGSLISGAVNGCYGQGGGYIGFLKKLIGGLFSDDGSNGPEGGGEPTFEIVWGTSAFVGFASGGSGGDGSAGGGSLWVSNSDHDCPVATMPNAVKLKIQKEDTDPQNPDCGWQSFQVDLVNDGLGRTIGIAYDLTPTQGEWLDNHNGALNIVSDYVAGSTNDQATKDHVAWAVDYLMSNPGTDLSIFRNRFLGVPEGQDGDYDANYWEDPNLSFPSQSLPSYNNFFDAFPKHNNPAYDSSEKMYNSVGGAVLAEYRRSGNPNTCALRVSKALNYSGVNIPNIPGTFKGADHKYYFLGASALKIWMKKTFGTPTGSNHIDGSLGGTKGQNFPALLNGKKGIYIMTPNDPSKATGFNASGHSDLLTYFTCDGNCYFGAKGGVKEILIWELQ